MSYPGDATLDPKVQQRILAAFGEAVRLYREEHPEESRTILRSIVEVDPRFIPAQRLDMAIEAGVAVNLSELLGEISAAAPVKADEIVASIKGALADGDFQGALVLAQSLLRELPGHPEGRRLALEAQNRLRQMQSAEGAPPHPTAAVHQARPPVAGGRVERSPVRAAPAPPVQPPPPASPGHGPEAPAGAPEEEDLQFEFLEEADAAGVFTSDYSPDSPAEALAEGADLGETVSLAGGMVFDDHGSGPGVDFGAPQAPAGEHVFEEGTGQASDAQDRVQDLLERGQEAFSHGAYQEAIDTWSRIFLIDPHHAEAERRIEQARRRREEVERLAEHHFYEAREALEKGQVDQARKHCEEVLKLQPQHFEAHDLLQRLDTPAAPPPPSTPPPTADEPDIFRDDFVPDNLISSSGAVPAIPDFPPLESTPAPRAKRRMPLPSPRRLPLPLPVMAVILALLAMLVVGGFLLRGKVFSGSSDTVSDALAEADRLASDGRLQEAVNLLQAVEADGAQAQEVSQKMLDYRRRLRVAPTAVPGLDTKPIREALAAGQHLKALRLLRALRARAPGNRELDEMERELVQYSSDLPGILDAVDGGQWDLARQRIAQALRDHPGDAELRRAWEAVTFNDAVLLLRRYEIAAANSLLAELGAQTNDPQVARLKELASSYLSRPIDPKYQIFVASIDLRPVE